MTRHEDDDGLAKIWRGASADAPDAMLDARILSAARAQRQRQYLAPLGAVAAACLILAFFLAQPVPEQARLDTSTFGLYEGRNVMVTMDTQMIRQMPGGSSVREIVHP